MTAALSSTRSQGGKQLTESISSDMGHLMHKDRIKEVFDQMAANYDTQWAKTAPIKSCLYFLVESFFNKLPEQARVLCVGVGTGTELAYLAQKHPAWRFTAVDPSGAMLDICRRRAEDEGFASRCHFHEGYLDSLSDAAPHDAALCFLVSQFILDPQARAQFFQQIAHNLKPEGLLASSDLASDVESPEYDVLLPAWMSILAATDASPESLERMRKAYANDVAVLPANRVKAIIESGGFECPTQFFQAGLIHAWISKRAATT